MPPAGGGTTPPIFFPEKENGRCDRPKERRLIGRLWLEAPLCLRNGSACQVVYLNDLTIFYLRCRFACDSLPLRNFRLLLDFRCLAFDCQGGIASLAAVRTTRAVRIVDTR